MKTDYLNYGGRQLPSYLGYGILDEGSVRLEEDILHADYTFECDDTLVHRVKWAKDRCWLDTFCHGKRGFSSTYPNLQQTLLSECMSWDLAKSGCFLFLSEQVCKQGNIFVDHPKLNKKEYSLSYYPSGKLLIFSLPLRQKTGAYTEFLEQIKGSPSLKFFRERRGHLLLANNELFVSVKPIIIADFIVPLARMVSAAKIMASAGIIQRQKHLRLLVKECHDSEKSFMQSFIGEGDFPYYGICFQEVEEEKYAGLAEMFRVQAEGLGMLTEKKE